MIVFLGIFHLFLHRLPPLFEIKNYSLENSLHELHIIIMQRSTFDFLQTTLVGFLHPFCIFV